MKRFERSGRGQEPSRGHKFSILENFVFHRDFTFQTLASFQSDLVGACLPQTLLIIRALRHEWNGVSCFTYRYRMWILAGCVLFRGAPCFCFALNLLAHGFQPYSSNIPPGHRSESNRHSLAGHCR